MNRRKNFWKRADIRLRMSCRKLTERQRTAVLLALFLPFLAGCVYTIGTALQGFGKRDGPGPEVEHIRPIGITFGTKSMNEKEQAENRHENEHRKTQDAAEAASAQGRHKPLTEEQKRKRAGYIVYPVLVLLCAGCVWLALSPSEKEQAKAGQGNGFNTEIPLPEDSRIQESKVAAYEHEELEKKEKERRSTYREMASLLDRKQADTVRLPDLPPEKPRKTAGQETARSPSAAYRDMNRTLNNFYEPAYDREKEELRKRVAELERRQAQQPEASSEYSMEEKLALMEKSYELAARYNGGQTAQVRPATERRKAEARPVRAVRHQVVSSLPRPSDDLERAAAFAGERNTGFHTPVGKTLASARNTIAACVHGTQTVADGQTLRIRLLEPMAVDDRLIPKGTVLTGGTRMQGERLDILISTVEHDGSVIPVELEVYDADGQQGIAVPNSMEYDALREITANMGGSMNSSINISTDAGAQIASDLGKGVIRGVSQYVTQKMQRVKVTLKAGHRVLLYPPGQ